jgi:hypothetical protein
MRYPVRQMPISPTLEGFRAAFRRPSFAFAEITWRWVIGATATALFFYGFFEYLKSLPVTNSELLLLRTRHPYLVSQALAHILRGSMGRVVASTLVASLMLSLLWMIVASAARMATVRAMLDYFHANFAASLATGTSNGEAGISQKSSEPASSPMRSLLWLNFLRVALALAAILGLLGASILTSFVSSDAHPRPGIAFLSFLPMAGLIALAWLSLNWLLSLAAMFAVRNGDSAMEAIGAAVSFIRERTGAVFAVSTWTGVGHVAVFMGATTVVSVPMSLAPVLSGRLVLAAMALTALLYFALVDWLYTARLAGYVCIAELPKGLMRPTPPPMPMIRPTPARQTPVQTTIDRNELILSDVPAADPQTSVDRNELILSDQTDLSS